MFKAIVVNFDEMAIYPTYINKYDDIYTEGGFNMFDVVYAKVAGEKVTIFVDDEGLLKSGNIVNELTNMGGELKLAGNLIFAGGVDDEGETLDVPDCVTMEFLKNNIKPIGIVK